MKIENRVRRFYELHKNKWFHIMNFSLDRMLILDKKEQLYFERYALEFYKL